MVAISGKAEHWGSRFGFLMAAVGSSVGLGNLWRFPFTAGENGGSAFIIIYLVCVILLGLPVLMAEYAIGRKGERSAIAGIRHIAETEGKSGLWTGIGWLGALTSLSIFSFYIVVATWVFDMIPKAFGGEFSTMRADAELIRASVGAAAQSIQGQVASVTLDATCSFVNDAGEITGVLDTDANGNEILRDVTTGDVSGCKFSHTIGNKFEIISYLAVFVALNVLVVARGIRGGIETAASILMPAFFLMLTGMVVFALVTGDAGRAAAFLLQPDFSKVTFETILSAVGQAFFSIGVGSCLMITYGAYLDRTTSIPSNSGLVASADTLVAIIAGFAIFPIVFAFGLNPTGGGGLFFVTMPVAFGEMAGGGLVGGIFFTLALFAAFTSSISLFEVGVSWLEDRPEISRAMGAVLLGLVLAIGVLYVFFGDLIDLVNYITGSILLPLGGILVALFAGWVLSRESLAEELGTGGILSFARLMLRYVIPIALGVILVFGVIAS